MMVTERRDTMRKVISRERVRFSSRQATVARGNRALQNCYGCESHRNERPSLGFDCAQSKTEGIYRVLRVEALRL